jgi:hypothetical protein
MLKARITPRLSFLFDFAGTRDSFFLVPQKLRFKKIKSGIETRRDSLELRNESSG